MVIPGVIQCHDRALHPIHDALSAPSSSVKRLTAGGADVDLFSVPSPWRITRGPLAERAAPGAIATVCRRRFLRIIPCCLGAAVDGAVPDLPAAAGPAARVAPPRGPSEDPACRAPPASGPAFPTPARSPRPWSPR